MHLLLIIYSLAGPGGAERVLTTLANAWVGKGWQVTLLTLDDGQPFYKVDDGIRHHKLNTAASSQHLLSALSNTKKRVQAIRAAIKDTTPDCVISFMSVVNVLTLLATKKLNIPVIVSERNNPQMLNIGPIWNFLRNWTYPRANNVVLQSHQTLNYLPSKVRQKVAIVPNPVRNPNIERAPIGSRNKTIVAMGSLTQQKGFDLLLRAFKKVTTQYADWQLHIWGEGPLLGDLEALRDNLSLEDHVKFCGRTTTPFYVFKAAGIFVLSSRYEGFPNVLCEAMACGTPSISFDCVSGPADIIRHEVDGLLVAPEDVVALAGAMAQLMGNDQQRQNLSQNAPDVIERFSQEKVTTQWETLIGNAVQEAKSAL